MQAASADAQKATDGTVGTLLCATRMRMGKDLQHIAAILHIRYNYLVAIEDGRYEDLPGQAYAIGFVRAYADHLGLDGDEIVRRYKQDSSGLKTRAVFEFPLPAPDSGVPSFALILIAMVMGMVIYGVWYSLAGSDRSAVQVIQEVPDRLAALLNPEKAASVGDGPIAVTEVDDEGAVLGEAADAAAASTVPEGETADVPSQVADIPISSDGPPMPADVVELRAKADVWITLKVSQQADRTQLLKKGEVFRAPEGGGGMTLVTAKPGDLDIVVNGQIMTSPDAGVFARGVPLDPDQLKAPATP